MQGRTGRNGVIDLIPFSENHDQRIAPQPNDFTIERHKPNLFGNPFHHHVSVEVNLLSEGQITYQFAGGPVTLKAGYLMLFSGASPHRVTGVDCDGDITNIYLSLGQFVRWGIPNELLATILAGDVICGRLPDPYDAILFDRLVNEKNQRSSAWRQTHLGELEMRFRRLALEGWTTLLRAKDTHYELDAPSRAVAHVELMVRHIAKNFSVPLQVKDIADAANLSPSHANHLFRDVMGMSIKKHLTNVRLAHATMLLTESGAKVATLALDSGFSSLSSFYDAFLAEYGTSPAQFRNLAKHSKREVN